MTLLRMTALFRSIRTVDWLLVGSVTVLMCVGLVTNFPLDSFSLDSLFLKQCVYVVLAVGVMLFGSLFPYSILRGPFISLILFLSAVLALVSLLLFAPEINGARSWFVFGPVALQPVEFVKIALIIILARFFASRHIHIRHIQHVLVSLGIAGFLFLLVFKQPDLGSSIVLLAIWGGMIFVSGVSKKHLVGLLLFTVVFAAASWQFIPQYQQSRILAFVAPLENLQSSGYTAYQSKIAVGSGELLGKGIGGGTQSKLGFLPLYESDFVFAAFAEEWGFAGVLLLFVLFCALGWRLLVHAIRGRTNFETLYVVGVFTFISSHVFLHVGVNTGLLPVTGITLPFMSYGGSHIIAEAVAIALVLGMSRSQFPGSFDELYRSKRGL